ncbi:MAG: PAS domain S-box protein, partial [Desulfomonilaceae bacterium]
LASNAIGAFVHPDDQEMLAQYHARRLQGDESHYQYPFRYIRKDGTVGWLEMNSSLIMWEERPAALCLVTGITEIKQAELALRDSERKYRELTELLPQTVFEIDTTGKFTFVNSAAEKLTGYSVEELLNGFNIMQFPAQEDREKAANDIKRVFEEQGLVITDHKALRKDGAKVPVLIYGSPMIQDKHIVGLRGVVIDISPLKQAEEEREKLRTQLFQSQKMESLGTLVGGIAHDFNNILQSIIGYSELLMDDKKVGDPGYNWLQVITQTALEGAELVRKLLALCQQGQVIPVDLDLNGQLREMSTLISRTLPHIVDLDLDLTNRTTMIRANKSEIDQLIMNLAINASESMPNGGDLRVATSIVSLDNDYCNRHLEAKPGAYVVLSVKDTGRGMDDEDLSRIFDPFFSTKERGSKRGTGLGLSVVRGIVKQRGGHITCESEPGKGTEFKVYFPATGVHQEVEETDTPTVQPGTAETILVIEDSPYIAELERKILENDGFRVLVATNAKEALDIYRLRKNEIALILLDLVMKGMSGRDCLMELIKIDPSVKALIVSGYSPEDELRREISPLVKGFVQKPFGMAQLLNEVRSVLGAD